VRSCLSVIVLGLAFLGAIVWFGGPPLASGLVALAIQSSGLRADRLDVRVTADPPLQLAAGRADRVVIDATGARWRGVRLASLELTLGTVDLLARTATNATGRLGGVELDASGGQTVVADVELGGAATAAATTIRIAAANVGSVAIDAFEARFGVRPTSASLVAPDTIRVVLGGLTVSRRLSIDGKGSVVAVGNGQTIVLFTPSAALGLGLTSVAATSSGLELRGTLDVAALLN